MKKISVNASRKYEIIMEPGLLEHGADHIREALGREPADTRLCIVTDETVAGLYGSREHALWQSQLSLIHI